MIVWEGKSPHDRKPIAAIATGFAKSKNPKTGNMIQIYILRSDINPLQAIDLNEDKSICGRCELRPQPGKMRGKCYVNVGQAPEQVYKKYKRGGYPPFDVSKFKGRAVRFGAYGDPAFIPKSIVKKIVKVSSGHTGYTHQWHVKGLEWTKEYFQASASNKAMARAAQNRGFHIFGVNLSLDYGKVCDYYENETTCENCLKCNGQHDIIVPAHGPAPVMKAWGK